MKPISPNSEDNIMHKYLQNLIDPWKSTNIKSKEHIEDIEIMITIIGETNTALTAASPKIKAPSIETDAPLEVGVLESPS